MTTAFAHTPGHEAHHQPGHPERPDRLKAVLGRLRADDVWNDLLHLDTEPAELDEAERVHTRGYLERLQEVVQTDRAQLDADTYVTTESLDLARRALGNLLGITRTVLRGEADNGFAAVRPPGHHATPSRAMGFCLLNNVAIAARYAQVQFGVERILIVDFDVHHGNGTQDVFYDDRDVLFMSTHQHPLYPGTGRAQETGTGDGESATVNIPLPPHTGDAGYRRAFQRVLAPIAHRFAPELVLLSAGFDAHSRERLAQMNLSLSGFADLVEAVMEWTDASADGRLVVTLEGGYDLEALSHGVTNTVRRLADPDAPITDPFGNAPAANSDVSDLLDDLADLHDV